MKRPQGFDPPDNNQEGGKRRWTQMSLRGTILMNVVIAILLFILYSYFVRPIRTESKISQVIENAGGHVERVDNHPDWLKRLLGHQDQRRVVIVHLENTDISDSDIHYLKDFSKLGGLYLNKTALTNDALLTIDELGNIEDMNLSDTKITFLQLNKLTKLQDLYLAGTPVERIQIRGLSSLKSLDLSNTKIDDADIEDLLEVPTLRSLKFNDTAITDQGLARLETLPELKNIYLDGTKVTPEGVARLRRARPGISVFHFR